MTTAAMVVGMVPLLIASGAGAASRYSIGLVIAARHDRSARIFTLFVTPAVYTYVARDHQREGAPVTRCRAACRPASDGGCGGVAARRFERLVRTEGLEPSRGYPSGF